MEAHHPHHVTHKKKWTEYLLEFFMSKKATPNKLYYFIDIYYILQLLLFRSPQ